MVAFCVLKPWSAMTTNKSKELSDRLASIAENADAGFVVAYRPILARLLKNDINAALLFSQLLYFDSISRKKDGWFYDTVEEVEKSTGLTKRQQQRARKVLAQAGLIETDLRGWERKYYYKIKYNQLEILIKSLISGTLSYPLQSVPDANGIQSESAPSEGRKAHLERDAKRTLEGTQSVPISSYTSANNLTNTNLDTTTTTPRQLAGSIGGGGGDRDKNEFFQTLDEIGIFPDMHPEYMRIAKAKNFTPDGLWIFWTKVLDSVSGDRPKALRVFKRRIKNVPEQNQGYDYANSNLTPDTDDLYLGEPVIFKGEEGYNADENFYWLLDVALQQRPELERVISHLRGFVDPHWTKNRDGAYVLTAYSQNAFELREVNELIPEISKIAQAVGDFGFDARLYP